MSDLRHLDDTCPACQRPFALSVIVGGTLNGTVVCCYCEFELPPDAVREAG